MQSDGLCKTLIVNEDIITRSYNLPINPPTQKRAARDAQQRKYTIKVEEKENPNNFVWFDLALTLDSASLIEIRHNCVNADRTGHGEAAWKCVRDRFHCNEATTAVSIVSKLVRFEISENEGIQNFFSRAQKLHSRFQHAGEHLSPTNFKALILTG